MILIGATRHVLKKIYKIFSLNRFCFKHLQVLFLLRLRLSKVSGQIDCLNQINPGLRKVANSLQGITHHIPLHMGYPIFFYGIYNEFTVEG